MPQRPHPVGPAICRRRRSSAAMRSGAIHIRSSMPSGVSTASNSSIIARVVDDALGAAEAEGEILQIGRGRHHDRMRHPVIGEARPPFPPRPGARPRGRHSPQDGTVTEARATPPLPPGTAASPAGPSGCRNRRIRHLPCGPPRRTRRAAPGRSSKDRCVPAKSLPTNSAYCPGMRPTTPISRHRVARSLPARGDAQGDPLLRQAMPHHRRLDVSDHGVSVSAWPRVGSARQASVQRSSGVSSSAQAAPRPGIGAFRTAWSPCRTSAQQHVLHGQG